ncbi:MULTISPECIES: PEGA domain-containing protein [unclassified Methanoregula]|uniref:PEGA domain-containing protein n=1 Tax=unclassified Methanoregula TaxID=2649730 RepID=UPI0009D6167F|nr:MULTISPECIES: PEGA domain-containing protein [unclassified Methanoregula]OPX64658.1 MAG: PEGA domain protein [Methanoregula sp. PtaB.Bin085]OPY36026.1 MAG: PEGA domain protein [Methanoregula sp. PtaU1.Bin006]
MKRFSLCICLMIVFLFVLAAIPPAAALPRITGVSPSTAPNDGTFTLTITGTELTGATMVRLNKCKLKTGGSSEPPFTGTIKSAGPTKIVASFNLNGKKVGQYDVSALVPTDISSDNWAVGEGIFQIYDSTSSKPTTTTTVTGTKTVTETTPEDSGDGENSVFFETNPTGATIYLDGDEIGKSPFIFRTNKDGTHDVLVKLEGYEDYSSTVTIVRNQRVYFSSGALIPLPPNSTSSANGSAIPGKTPTKTRITLKLTPLGTVETPVEESPVGPATILWAVAAAMAFVVIRRR